MSVQIRNLQSEDVLTYSLPLLLGDVRPPLAESKISVCNRRNNTSMSWPVYNGTFKALVELKPGENIIELMFYGEVVELVLVYKVPPLTRFVRPVYIKCHDDPHGDFQGPEDEDCSAESACQRIALGAKLIQTLTAEKLAEHGFGRKTFLLETDLDAKAPACHVFTSSLSVACAQQMTGAELWLKFACELMSAKTFTQKENCKWFCFMSFTRYEAENDSLPKSHIDVLKQTKGYAALGGGGLALFSTGNLHCWAETLDQVPLRFTDTRKIDRSKFMDDSAYRGFYWANYSTGLGSSLHELGHTFDLAHTRTGIMARGFDDLYRVFIVRPLRSRASSCSRDSSRLTTPSPYSSRSRSRVASGNSIGAEPCFLRPLPTRLHSQPSFPDVIHIEVGFAQLPTKLTQCYTVHHYDGSETQTVVTRQSDGTETRSQLTLSPDGEWERKDVKINQLDAGKTGMQVTACRELPMAPSALPHSAVDGPDSVQEFVLQGQTPSDAGAHWHRSSAVILNYHKWFNEDCEKNQGSSPEITGGYITSPCGLRLIELRNHDNGTVVHHWEFLHDDPPTEFKVNLDKVKDVLPADCVECSVMVEDSRGNISKKKVHFDDL
ncbi:hypothetical protein NP493_1293g01022 [Ridgeia piscesae]|uniref:Zinc metalloproteinase n=1 Tax=Ridgeia piscesae TaxID=27915 RepID=A0AAD9NGW7_RIDPI|nr:hypothetical protein NP493_1293g01022 [Ridgeia piscesae]